MKIEFKECKVTVLFKVIVVMKEWKLNEVKKHLENQSP
jgi:hypothetical protein